MTRAQRAVLRARYVKDQSGLCYYCKHSLNKSPPCSILVRPILVRKSYLRYRVHLHHSHKTGLTLGAVHALCNAVLWHYHGE
jgi:hypothetical protein